MATGSPAEALRLHLEKIYAPEEYPALRRDMALAAERRPFDGVTILDATPLFTNTLVKHLALLAGGASLTVGYGNGIPFDAEVVELLRQWGIPACPNGTPGTYDLILDCGALNISNTPRIGTVELTRSGAAPYRHAPYPVYLADAGVVKEIETGLGTGDGVRRAMELLHLGPLAGRRFLLFGCGKVGRGIALSLLRQGVDLTVTDYPEQRSRVPAAARFVPLTDRETLQQLAAEAWCVVSATGLKGAVGRVLDLKPLLTAPVLFANMGVEDEFGPDLPPERALNGKAPLNFMLPEPTLLRYIDPTMALDNFGARKLLAEAGQLPCGLIEPTLADQQPILDAVRAAGLITDELNAFTEGKQ